MHKQTLKMALLAFAVFASAMMVVALVITSLVRYASAGMPQSVYEVQAPSSYIVRTYNGHIAVYYGEMKDTPAIETTIDVTLLRAFDREKLETGIPAETYDDVLKLLEDFGS